MVEKIDLEPELHEMYDFKDFTEISLENKTYMVKIRDDCLPELICYRTIAYFKQNKKWYSVRNADRLRQLFKIMKEDK
ncbi:MAG: hypothetical protein GF317_20815 [Candidatus Lokiarchaeota archaeon]|nr:hypothetical protein [Candidatus Lokiarchaeota archaeon]